MEQDADANNFHTTNDRTNDPAGLYKHCVTPFNEMFDGRVLEYVYRSLFDIDSVATGHLQAHNKVRKREKRTLGDEQDRSRQWHR